MHRAQKHPSKVCQTKWEEHCDQIHKEKMANMKPSIDNSQPKAQGHLEHRRKRDQQVEERLSTIEKHNLMLLNRMVDIMKSPSKSIPPASPEKKPKTKSLNEGARKKQMEEINEQNQALLKRLQGATAYYDHKDWDQFGKTQESYLKNISEYKVDKKQGATKKSPPRTAPLIDTGSSASRSKPAKRSTSAVVNKSTTKKTTDGKKKVVTKKSKGGDTSSNSDGDSLQLSDLDDGDIGDIAAGLSNLDVSKGDFRKLADDGKDDNNGDDDDDDADLSDMGSEFSDSLDLDNDDDDKVNDDVDGEKSATSQAETGGDEGESETTYTADKVTVVSSSHKTEEFDKDREAYKPKDDDDDEE